MIAAEAIESLGADHGILIPVSDARRNIVSRKIDLNALLGKKIRVGNVHCCGQRLAEPRARPQKIIPSGTPRGLVYTGGLRVDILDGGTIGEGAVIMIGPISDKRVIVLY